MTPAESASMPDVVLETRYAPGRAMVRLRVSLAAAAQAAAILDLPVEPLTSRGNGPTALWIAPDQWLLIDDAVSSDELMEDVRGRLGALVHIATDASDALACFVVEGPAACNLLSMGTGVDFDSSSFGPGKCVRTRFAKLALLIRCIEPDRFELFVDSSTAEYLEAWLRRAMAGVTSLKNGRPECLA
jgi:heterotetrameric sarcosine oxidase gamma subunit